MASSLPPPPPRPLHPVIAPGVTPGPQGTRRAAFSKRQTAKGSQRPTFRVPMSSRAPCYCPSGTAGAPRRGARQSRLPWVSNMVDTWRPGQPTEASAGGRDWSCAAQSARFVCSGHCVLGTCGGDGVVLSGARGSRVWPSWLGGPPAPGLASRSAHSSRSVCRLLRRMTRPRRVGVNWQRSCGLPHRQAPQSR